MVLLVKGKIKDLAHHLVDKLLKHSLGVGSLAFDDLELIDFELNWKR